MKEVQCRHIEVDINASPKKMEHIKRDMAIKLSEELINNLLVDIEEVKIPERFQGIRRGNLEITMSGYYLPRSEVKQIFKIIESLEMNTACANRSRVNQLQKLLFTGV